MDSEQTTTSLREKVIQGGIYLVVRQGLGLFIGLGGMFFLTRMIGPENYGTYVSAIGILIFLSKVASLGLNTYLIRQENELNVGYFNQAFTLILLNGLIISLLASAFSSLIGKWIDNPGFAHVFILMVITLPLNSVIFTATAKLERALNYKAVASIELLGQVAYYSISLPLAYKTENILAPVAGYWGQQLVLLFGALIASKYKPVLQWSTLNIRDMVRYGFGFSSSMWVWQMRDLVNPVIVGRYAGADIVGYIAFAIKIVEALSFVKQATWRLSITALAKLQNNEIKLKKAVSEGMILQVFALAPFLVGFAIISVWVIPSFFGNKWEPFLDVFPFIAISYLVNAVFNMHSSVLYVKKLNMDVTFFHIIHMLLFVGGAFAFVPWMGIEGYGLAEILALLSYVVVHKKLKKVLLPSYSAVIPWLIAFIPLLFVTMIGYKWLGFLVIPVCVILSIPNNRKYILNYKEQVLRRSA